MTISRATFSPARLAPTSFALEDDENEDDECTRIFARPSGSLAEAVAPARHRYVVLTIPVLEPTEELDLARSERGVLLKVGYAMLCGSLIGIISSAAVLACLAR